MSLKVRAFLLCSLLLAEIGCNSKSEGVENTTTPSLVSSNVSRESKKDESKPGGQTQINKGEPKSVDHAETGSAKGKIDACQLIAESEIEAVQGERVMETKSTHRISGPFAVSQCFYAVESFTKSVSLEVTQSEPANPAKQRPQDFWQERFHHASDKKKGRDPDGERDRDREGENEKELSKPRPIPGIGDEAFWVGNAIVGALYVLKKNVYFRISTGGREEEAMKIEKAKTLARKVLKRL